MQPFLYGSASWLSLAHRGLWVIVLGNWHQTLGSNSLWWGETASSQWLLRKRSKHLSRCSDSSDSDSELSLASQSLSSESTGGRAASLQTLRRTEQENKTREVEQRVRSVCWILDWCPLASGGRRSTGGHRAQRISPALLSWRDTPTSLFTPSLPLTPPPKSARCPSAPRSRNANTKPPIQMIQYYLNPLARVYWGYGGNDGSSGGG